MGHGRLDARALPAVEMLSQGLFLMTLVAKQDQMLRAVGSPLYRSWCLKAHTSHHFSTLERLAWLLGEGARGAGS